MILLTGIDTATGASVAISTLAIPYDLKDKILGVPASSQLLLGHICARQITFPVNFAGSKAYAGTAPTADVTFAINRTVGTTVTQIGTLTFTAGSQTGTFTAASAVTTNVGDLITVVFQTGTDSSFADVILTLVGSIAVAV